MDDPPWKRRRAFCLATVARSQHRMYAWPLHGALSLGQSARSHSVSWDLTGRPFGWVTAVGHVTVTVSRSLDSVPLTSLFEPDARLEDDRGSRCHDRPIAAPPYQIPWRG